MNSPAKICAVITEETVDTAIATIKRANREADMIELRLDYLRDFDFTKVEHLRILFDEIALPTIITCRAVDEGGKQYVADEIRLNLLVEGAKRFAAYCDVEAAHYEQAAKLSPDISKLIVSYHNFNETPANLSEIYEQITKFPASIHKIATRANSINDTLLTFHLLEGAQKTNRQLIAISMNEAGVITRLLGCSRGSFLTYGSLAEGRESAPGQFSCEDLRNLFRLHQITCDTAITGIIGNPVLHSASPAIHNRAFAALGLDFIYLPLEVVEVPDFFKRFVQPNTREMDWKLHGFSVTIPHKVAVLPLLDELDATAEKIGAVNTVVLQDQRLIGYNTDVDGAMQPLEKICSLADKHCAVIGAGGAARAVIYGLLARGAQVTVYTRDVNRARTLAENFAIELLPMDSLVQSAAEILINTTPIGMHGHSEGENVVPVAALKNCGVVYDLVYTPLETQLLKDAKARGMQTISGLDMLVAQAGLQFELWTAQKPNLTSMRSAALEAIRQ